MGTGAVGAVPGDTKYDITVIGPNRFLRRYIGDAQGAGAELWLEASYYGQHGRDCNEQPKLKLLLRNDSRRTLTFTITFNNYSTRPHEAIRVFGEKAVRGEQGEQDQCRKKFA